MPPPTTRTHTDLPPPHTLQMLDGALSPPRASTLVTFFIYSDAHYRAAGPRLGHLKLMRFSPTFSFFSLVYESKEEIFVRKCWIVLWCSNLDHLPRVRHQQSSFYRYNNLLIPLGSFFIFSAVSHPSPTHLPKSSHSIPRGQMTAHSTLIWWDTTQRDKIQFDIMSASWFLLGLNILTLPVIAKGMLRRTGDGKCKQTGGRSAAAFSAPVSQCPPLIRLCTFLTPAKTALLFSNYVVLYKQSFRWGYEELREAISVWVSLKELCGARQEHKVWRDSYLHHMSQQTCGVFISFTLADSVFCVRSRVSENEAQCDA